MYIKSCFTIVLTCCLLFSCKNHKPDKKKRLVENKAESIMLEYEQIKAKLEPQGYEISTDSIDKIFIDHAVTINYHK